eukprot:scaffold99140_cov61-Phaeocystis_antarctica.AAC.2
MASGSSQRLRTCSEVRDTRGSRPETGEPKHVRDARDVHTRVTPLIRLWLSKPRRRPIFLPCPPPLDIEVPKRVSKDFRC